MSDLIDSPKGVRAGEELDANRLSSYLADKLGVQDTTTLRVQQFPSGHSNLTYLVAIGDEEYVLRRPPFGSKVKTAHDMGREYRVLSKLHAVYPLAPEPLLYCEDESVLGAKFYVMKRIRGSIIRRQMPPGLTLGPAQVRALHLAVADNLARIHAVDVSKAGLSDLGKPEGYVERQVKGWTQRYFDSQTDDLPAVVEIAKWLEAHLPEESGATLIHNDYKLDNLVLDPADPTRIVGVLDWEMATLGDPLMDLGAAVAYWVESSDADELKFMRWAPTDDPGAITRAEFVKRYEDVSGRTVKDPLFYFLFGCFKNIVIMQQIYYRFKKGLTKDERFAMILMGIQILAAHAKNRLEIGRV